MISRYNHEGYPDPTTYEALTAIERQERKARFRPIVYICSPYSGDVEQNTRQAQRYCRYAVDSHCLPIAPHLLFPQFMDDRDPEDRDMMYGYATDETREMLPIPFVLATEALEQLARQKNILLLPDAKCQVTYDYRRKRIDTFLISTQHTAGAPLEEVREHVEIVMRNVARHHHLNTDFKALVNPTGRFVVGGSYADTGVTGRKIIADTYGGACRHGGGAFSGKDPTKVDRSAAYMARKIAKDTIRAKFAKRCEVQLAYAIGVKEPVSVAVDCFGTNRVPLWYIRRWIRKNYDLTPAGIISFLGLRDVDYNHCSALGHFWRSWMPWEK